MTIHDKTLLLCQVLPQAAQRMAQDLRAGGVRVHIPREQYSVNSTSKKFREFGYLALDRAPVIQRGVKAVGHSEHPDGITFEPITSEAPAVTRRVVGRVHRRDLHAFYSHKRQHAVKGRHAIKAASAPIWYGIGDRVKLTATAFEGHTGCVTQITGKNVRMQLDVGFAVTAQKSDICGIR